MKKAIELFLSKHRRHSGAFADMDDRTILDMANLTKNGKITPTTLIRSVSRNPPSCSMG